MVTKPLPSSKGAIEDVVLDKFLGALERHKRGTSLGTATRGEWPDYIIQMKSEQLGIELAEVTIPEHARLAERQRQYADRVKSALTDVLPRLDGMHIQLEDRYQDPPYPGVDSGNGRALVAEISGLVRGAVPEMESLAVGELLVFRWREGPDQPTVGAVCTRVAPAGSGKQAVIRYLGSFPIQLDEANAQLTRTIDHKLAKHYAPFNGDLWLLTYGSVAAPAAVTAEAVAMAKAELAGRSVRPFDQIWYLLPTPREPVYIERLAP